MIYLLIALAVVVGYFVSAAIFFGTSRLFKISAATYKKSLIIVLLSGIAGGVTNVIFRLIGLGIIAQILSAIVGYFVVSYLFKRYYQVSWKKALGVYATNIVIGIVIGIILAVFVAVPIRLFVMEPFVVSGQSMSPHLNQGDYIFIEKFDRNFQRDDVIVFKTNTGSYLIKRIIGVPSEKVQIKDGKISINGSAFQDQYVASPIAGEVNATLGSDEYFVLSDSASPSLDSRTFGPVKAGDIVGKVFTK